MINYIFCLQYLQLKNINKLKIPFTNQKISGIVHNSLTLLCVKVLKRQEREVQKYERVIKVDGLSPGD